MQGPRFVVGVDFGTTFSGIAFTAGGSADDVEVHSQWPGGGNRTSAKVPSDISYEGGRIQWGYQVGTFTEACRGLKLLLDEDNKLEWTPSIDSKKVLQEYGKSPVEATSDYLRQLLKQTEQVIQRRFGLRMQDLDLHFVLSVPAVWSDKAKDATLKAVVAAGASVKNISLVSEPEAAALYSLRVTRPNSISTNDVIIVCDAGGGTVDLISYQIKSVEPLCLTEVTEGTGAICGSALLDARFEALLRQRMGPDKYYSLSSKSKEAAITYWQERVKPNYSGKFDEDFTDVDYFIPVAGATDDPTVPIEDGFFLLSNDDVEGIFDPIVRQIEDLVSGQILAVLREGLSAKTIILVGGFGASEYLFHRLQKATPNAKVLQPPDGWSAVVRGAVYRGLEGNKVESRIARRHYGVVFRRIFDDMLDCENDPNKVWDPLEERYFIDDQMEWYINKSSKISESKPIKMGFYRAVPVKDKRDLVLQNDLYFCNDEEAHGVWNKRIMKLCQLEADLRVIPQSLFERKKNSKGVEYFKVPYTLTMTPTSASLLFELEFNGVCYGSVRSRY
ncbi:Hsp70 family protein [Aspergillus undulatus]|uniref:Hsp70 family protein n=1 Tax=Aspergillus undulatus TaxID=1810928 RepID=UPI003CCD8964